MDSQLELFEESPLPFDFQLFKQKSTFSDFSPLCEKPSNQLEFEQFELCAQDLTINEPETLIKPKPVARPRLQIKHSNQQKPKRTKRYEKNICGYVLKKVVREFVGSNYTRKMEEMCANNLCNPAEARGFYLGKVESICGASYLKVLTVPERAEEISMKRTFLEFMEWFLRERYLRHLLEEGRMESRSTYVNFKNRFFPGAIAECRAELQQFERNLGFFQVKSFDADIEQEALIF